MDLSKRTDFFHGLLHFFENLVWLWEPLINSWFNVPISQMYIFILFVSVSVLFDGVFSLLVSSIKDKMAAEPLIYKWRS